MVTTSSTPVGKQVSYLGGGCDTVQDVADFAKKGWHAEQVIKFYTTYAKDYDASIESSTYPAPERIANWITTYFKDTKEKTQKNPVKLLDIGCGTGQSSKTFFNSPYGINYEVYGVDATKEMLMTASIYPFKEIRCQDVEEEMIFETPFDALVCVGVLDFIRDLPNFFSKAAGLCNHNAIFGFTIPNNGDLNSVSEQQLQLLVSRAGFEILQRELVFGYEDSESQDQVQYHCVLAIRV